MTKRSLAPNTPPWVVVDYGQDGAKKMIGFVSRGFGEEHLYQTLRDVCGTAAD